jgi:hypothetical protein
MSLFLPHYLRVAHWLCEKAKWMTSRDVAIALNVPIKQVSADFAKIRYRPDIFIIHETSTPKGVLMRVLLVQPYVLDGRRCPRLMCAGSETACDSIGWDDLRSLSWHKLRLKTELQSKSMQLTWN